MTDTDFDTVPDGSIPASKSGVYRRDHFAIRSSVYGKPMATQQPRDCGMQQQQMQQQQGSRHQQR